MAKGGRWSDDQDGEVREMRNAETVLGVICEREFVQDRDHWRAAVRSKDSSPVRRGAVGKGLRKLHLAGRLPYLTYGSEGAGKPQCFPATRLLTPPMRLGPEPAYRTDAAQAKIYGNIY